MASNITIKTFSTILTDIRTKLTSLGSQITNTAIGAFNLLERVFSLMLADLYVVLNDSLDQGFPSEATGAFLDMHLESVGLTRKQATKASKQFLFKRDTAGTIEDILVGDIFKSPTIPARDIQRWFTVQDPLLAVGKAGTFTDSIFIGTLDAGTGVPTGVTIIDNGTNFITLGLKKGDIFKNITQTLEAKILQVVSSIEITLDVPLGNVAGDSYSVQFLTDFELTFPCEADEPGTEFNNMETLLGTPGVAIVMTIESGLSVVDDILSTGKDFLPGTDLELDPAAFLRYVGQFKQLSAGATRPGYISTAIESDATVEDANVRETRISPFTGADVVTNVLMVVSGIAGNRALVIGTNASEFDNFTADYRDAAAETGKEDTGGSSTVLSDGTADFTAPVSVAIGDIVHNTSDGSKGTVTSFTATTVTMSAGLSGGSTNLWNVNDKYEVRVGNAIALGNKIHNFIRDESAPLTDFIFLETVTEVVQNLVLSIKVLDGFDKALVLADLNERLTALFLPQKDVKDVTVLKVGEDLLATRLYNVLDNTSGIKDYLFTTPALNVTVLDNTALILGTITIGDL